MVALGVRPEFFFSVFITTFMIVFNVFWSDQTSQHSILLGVFRVLQNEFFYRNSKRFFLQDERFSCLLGLVQVRPELSLQFLPQLFVWLYYL